jgi:hypothetical protein
MAPSPIFKNRERAPLSINPEHTLALDRGVEWVDFWNWIITAGIDRMASDQPLKGKPDPFRYSETLDRPYGIRGTGRVKTTTGAECEREGMLIDMDQGQ